MSESEQKRMTTAEAVGKLYNELIEQGVPEYIVGGIVRDAAIENVRVFGIAVRA